MLKKCRCCEVETMCGRSLWHGVVFVGTATSAISLIVLIWSVGYVCYMAAKGVVFNHEPLLAFNLVVALVFTCLSTYQIVISMMLLWQAAQARGNIFLCSLWYVSHVVILVLHCIFVVVKVVICFNGIHYWAGLLAVITGTLYQAIFIYFAMIVNSFLHSLDQERYL